MGNLHLLTTRNRFGTPDTATGLPTALNTPALPLNVLLAGDNPARAEDLATVAQHEDAAPARIVTAHTFREAIGAVQDDASLNAAVVDLALPGLFGAQGIERLAALRPSLPIIVTYEQCMREQCIALWRAGVAGVFPQSLSGRAMVGALQEVLRGRPCALLTPADPTGAVPVEKAAPAVAAPAEERPAAVTVQLSPRERQVAALIAKGQSNKEIARRLDLQEPTVKVYVEALVRKLAVRNRTEAATRLLALNLA